MLNIKKIVNTRVNHLTNSNQTFEAIYSGMFLNPEYIFAETNDGYKITKYTFKEVDELSQSNRDLEGFGSTGTK